jgi:DNA topoisomerase-1
MVKKDGKYKLVIVESPGKIKKLESILGKGYKVVSSYGHIMDLYPNKMSVDFDNDFEPEYTIITGTKKFQDKKKVVSELKKLAKDASKIIIAADEDREGEMIGWSYQYLLKLKDSDYERITFNSITKDEVLRAISNPGKLDMKMVESQKTRRILDRITGFKISPELSKLLGGKLSAGRVQSIVLRLICDKENEINDFFEGENSSFFKYIGLLNNKDDEYKCELFENKKNTKFTLTKLKDAHNLIQKLSKSTYKINDINQKISKRNPSPPYTTSTVQQDASTKLNFNVKRTMSSLQKLYEAGLTTYLRTDSTNLSKDALKQIKDYIKKNHKGNHNETYYGNKKGNTQEAHEAIRPVKISKNKITVDGKKIGNDEIKLYDLIWKRTVASQMKSAEYNVYDMIISISKKKDLYFKTTLEELVKIGYLSVYGFDKEKIKLPTIGTKLNIKEIKCSEEYQKPPMRYTEAGLIKKMDPKNLNIGRPATYAEIISTVQAREYVKIQDIDGQEKDSINLTYNPSKDDDIIEKKTKMHLGREKNKFKPTIKGEQVNNTMLKYFPEIMEYKFTSKMENDLDKIAEGKKKRSNILNKFWKELEPCINDISKQKKPEKILGQNADGFNIIATTGKYGPMLKMFRSDDKKDFVSAPIKSGGLDNITLKKALQILKYPKLLGKDDKYNVELKKGKYGLYIQRNNDYVNISDDEEKNITLKTAVKKLNERKKEKEKKMDSYLFYHKNTDMEYKIDNGKYGKYLMVKNLKKKKSNVEFFNIQDNTDLKLFTPDNIHDKYIEYKKNKYNRTKNTKKK